MATPKVVVLFAVLATASAAPGPLSIDSSKFGRTFDGIGGLSGGGATSRLLVDYKEPQRSQILDYLFKPNYGANLQILKVEIGGDSQSTDGTESSHMHSADDLDYNRGYEWWLLQEAKKRNPEIKTYGLPWAFPGWVGGKELSGDPFKHPELTSNYILKWLEGARNVYDVEIDYIGIWNERPSDATYAKTLRKMLDSNGFEKTVLVANDRDAAICDEMAKDPEYVAAIGVVGLHYPSDFSNYSKCRKLGFGVVGERGSKAIWASEESSSYDDANGAACWGRIITSHWVLQGMTSSIMWNLVGSYFHGTNWYASSFLTAAEPWSGHYDNMLPVWATAHITQFTNIGWDLLAVGSGSGQLPQGGFYATYSDPKGDDWTLTVVKISEDHAPCTRPPLPHFNVSSEKVTFTIAEHMKAKELAVWYSNFEQFKADGSNEHIFQRLANVVPKDGKITMDVQVGAFITVSTILEGPQKGKPATDIPKSQPAMPLPLKDDFEAYKTSQEAKWWSDQIGAFEVHYEKGSQGNKVMKMMVPNLPIGWADPGSNGPMTLVGMREWQDIKVTAKFALPADAPAHASGCVATRVDQMWKNGIVFCLSLNGTYTLSVGGPTLGGAYKGEIYASGHAKALQRGSMTEISLAVDRGLASASVGGSDVVKEFKVRVLDAGFAAFGANDWFGITFDDVAVEAVGDRWSPASSKCKADVGVQLHAMPCTPNAVMNEDDAFDLLADWGIRHVASGLCAAVTSREAGATVVLAKCDPSDPKQQFKNDYTNIRNSMNFVYLKANWSLSLAGSTSGQLFLHHRWIQEKNVAATSPDQWFAWSFFPNSKQLRNQYTANLKYGYPRCLSTCAPAESELVFVL
eukprot:TRINITY_DN22249_c0_g1_i1.p1 TRINITY_DN22249_c0_g1~~TRINITY_DN22249_c0_g1_i1.p1  ORF type:complete len:857 (-),score=158.67 TRINITY_DN22249_c0_g1_i1:250-2820(-)